MTFSGNNSNPGVRWDERMIDGVVNNVITVALCVCINYINATLVYTFLSHEMLNKNSRYLLFIHLVINDIVLLTMLTLLQLLAFTVNISVSLCILLVLLAAAADFTNPLTLVMMALECFIAVCYPLRHSNICTLRKTYFAIAIIWVVCALNLLPDVFIVWATEPLEFFQSRVMCLKVNVMRHPYIAEKDKIIDAVVMALVWMTLIYTYFRILFTAKSAAADARKARNTVLLHSFQLMLSMLTYVYFVIMYSLYSLFPRSYRAIRFALTVLINIMPRLVSPLVYGLRDKTFRKYLKQHMFCTTVEHRVSRL